MKTKSGLTIFLFVTVFLLTQTVKAQFPKDSTTGKVKYSGIVDLSGSSKEKIYKKAKAWIVSTLKSADNIIELDDVNMDKLVATGTTIVDSLKLPYVYKDSFSRNSYINFKFIILIKEGRLKYTVENFILYYTDSYYLIETSLEDTKPGNGWTKKMIEKFNISVYVRVNKTITNIIANFIRNMKTEENNNW
jgi:hypothetical protein